MSSNLTCTIKKGNTMSEKWVHNNVIVRISALISILDSVFVVLLGAQKYKLFKDLEIKFIIWDLNRVRKNRAK